MVLRRAGCKNEKIVFILDESNILESGFLERMNTLLANGEVSSAFFLFQQPVTMVHYRVVYREDPMHFSHFFKYHSFHSTYFWYKLFIIVVLTAATFAIITLILLLSTLMFLCQC